MDKDKLAEELIENLEHANADPEAADERDFERTRDVEPVSFEENEED